MVGKNEPEACLRGDVMLFRHGQTTERLQIVITPVKSSIFVDLYLMLIFARLSNRQKEELLWFYDFAKVSRLEQGKDDIASAIRLIKDEYDKACAICEDSDLGAQGLKYYMERACGEGPQVPAGMDVDKLKTGKNDLRYRVARYVHDTKLKRRFLDSDPGLTGKLHIFHLIRNKSSYHERVVEAEDVGRIAQLLVNKNGWKRYKIKKARPNVKYPNSLIEDIQAELEKADKPVSKTTIKRRLTEFQFELPFNSRHPVS